jgi:hypothetical protein
MPFDASGNFTRNYNFEQDRDNGIKILASRVDGEFDNFATGMNLVFFRDGRVPMQADLRMNINRITGIADGSAASPALKFNTDASTGPYLPGLSQYGISVNGTQRAVFNTTGMTVTGDASATTFTEGGTLLSAKYAQKAAPTFTGITVFKNGQTDTYALSAQSQLRFEFNTGGYAHAVVSRHNVAGAANNALDFWLNNGTLAGDPSIKAATLDASAGLTVNVGSVTAPIVASAPVAGGGLFIGARNGGSPSGIIYAPTPGDIRINNGGGADLLTANGTTVDFKNHTTLYLNAQKILMQHDGSNGFFRSQTGGLYLGGGGLSSLVLTSGGDIQFPINGKKMFFTDTGASNPYFSAEAGGNFAFYTTSSTGTFISAYHVSTRAVGTPTFFFDVPVQLPPGSVAVTQAAGDATTNIATTAFADRLRGLPSRTVAGTTLVVADRGGMVKSSGAVTVPANVFAADDVVVVYNNSGVAISLTQGASLTLRQSGTANTGTRSIAQRGFATITFISATEAVASGDVS